MHICCNASETLNENDRNQADDTNIGFFFTTRGKNYIRRKVATAEVTLTQRNTDFQKNVKIIQGVLVPLPALLTLRHRSFIFKF